MKLVKKIFVATALASTILAGAGTANAANYSGNYGANGYSVINFATSGGIVDMVFNSGYVDPTFSLFNSAGNHLISNDDANNSLKSHITSNLGAGNYSLLISYCCAFINEVQTIGGAAFTGTDGFNVGSYWVGGTSTLASLSSYLDGQQVNLQSTYDISITNTNIPEPGTLALVALAAAGLGLRRKQH